MELIESDESLKAESVDSEVNIFDENELINMSSNTTLKEFALEILVLKYLNKVSDLAEDDIFNLIALLIPEKKIT